MDEGASQAERLCQVPLAGALAHLAALREGGSLAGTESPALFMLLWVPLTPGQMGLGGFLIQTTNHSR